MTAIEITNSTHGIISGNLLTRWSTYDNSNIEITDCTDIAVVGNSTEGGIVIDNVPQVSVDNNKTGNYDGIQLWDCPQGTVKGSTVIGGHIGLTGSDNAVASGNTISRDNVGGVPYAILVDGAADGVTVTNNTYLGLPNGVTGTVATKGIYIAGGVTGTSIGWNKMDRAIADVYDAGTGTVNLDVVPFSFGTDANPLVVGGGNQPFPYSGSGTVVGVRVVVGVAPSGASLIVDVNVNGSSLWASQGAQPVVVAAGTDSGVVKPNQNAELSDGDVFTVDVDQVGSSVAGGYLTVVVYVRPNGGS